MVVSHEPKRRGRADMGLRDVARVVKTYEPDPEAVARLKRYLEGKQTSEDESMAKSKSDLITDDMVAGWFERLKAGETGSKLAGNNELGVSWPTIRKHLDMRGYDYKAIFSARPKNSNFPLSASAPAGKVATVEAQTNFADQLAAVQRVLAMAEAEEVSVSGTIDIDLRVQVRF